MSAPVESDAALSVGVAALVETAAQGIRDAGAIAGGIGRTDRLRANAKEIVDEAVTDATAAVAYGDLLRAYICAPDGGRDALFLEIAYRLAISLPGDAVNLPSQSTSSRPDLDPSRQTSAPLVDQAALADFVRSTLALIQSLQTQTER